MRFTLRLQHTRALGTAVLALALCAQQPVAHANIVTTDQLTARHDHDAERARVQAFLDRASVRNQIQAMGVGALDAQQRVAALDDAEVHDLATRIDALPAGGNVAGFTDQQLIIVLLIVILVVVLVSA